LARATPLPSPGRPGSRSTPFPTCISACASALTTRTSIPSGSFLRAPRPRLRLLRHRHRPLPLPRRPPLRLRSLRRRRRRPRRLHLHRLRCPRRPSLPRSRLRSNGRWPRRARRRLRAGRMPTSARSGRHRHVRSPVRRTHAGRRSAGRRTSRLRRRPPRGRPSCRLGGPSWVHTRTSRLRPAGRGASSPEAPRSTRNGHRVQAFVTLQLLRTRRRSWATGQRLVRHPPNSSLRRPPVPPDGPSACCACSPR
jgi:hypothetical protein